MNNQDLIKNLKNLPTGQPNPEWVARNREIMLAQIRAQQGARLEIFSKDGAQFTWQAVKTLFPYKLAAQVVMVLFLLFVFGFGASITTVWADRSLPGDFLYPIKLTGERVQLTLAGDEESRAKLEVGFAGKRIEEVRQLSVKQGEVGAAEQIKQALAGYEKNMKSASDRLNTMAAEKAAPGKIAEVASLVNNQAEDFSDVLSNNTSLSADQKSSAVEISEQTAVAAVGIIIDQNQSGEGAMSVEEIKQLVIKKIGNSKEKLEYLTTEVKAIEVLSEEEQTRLAGFGAEYAVGRLRADLEEAGKQLRDAEQLLEPGEILASFDKVKNVLILVSNLEGKIVKAKNLLIVPATPVETEAGDDSAATNTNIIE